MKKIVAVIFLLIILIPLICIVDYQLNPWGDGGFIVLIRNGLKTSGGKLFIYEKGEMIVEDFSDLSPYKISSGIFRDKYKGIAIGVHTASPFHPKPHEKIFIYVKYKDRLKPFFRSSKTSAVLQDFFLYDINQDGNSDIVTIENAMGENYVYWYKNIGFGFDVEESLEIKRAEFVNRNLINITTNNWERIINLNQMNILFERGDVQNENK